MQQPTGLDSASLTLDPSPAHWHVDSLSLHGRLVALSDAVQVR